ncbi:Desumoylating isopeptidase 1 [Tolypocladium ophioglossoides CBS 100239]|uniref:Desumoylating isopeptidase 1 n=1 Tax=Tolypocladium ophioglossoides (strain CBS 100239) TaxID=1163406 RepID=A0A0L0NIA5_TOLOC|nr:Desumoylating isopeptidase 1 [Tolypocladium ophioglossoides CBS 100239]
MDVHLLVYDLSRGLARQMSTALLGFQLDAIFHTSIELSGREYVYDGGIIAIAPGSSHLGQAMRKIHLGVTNLPMDVIEEYLDSIRPIFTLEAYDLFHHNCNNFTDSFSNFLVGKGIPGHITSMPQAVMDSPMGRMMLPQLTRGVNGGRSNGSILGLEQSATAPAPNGSGPAKNNVKIVTGRDELSPTCSPCKVLYPIYDRLAEEYGDKATFIKVDISQPQATSIAQQFSIKATPTFVTFLKGEEENRWSGADQASLRGNVQLLVQMAHPIHPHEKLRLPSFSNPNVKPVLFSKIPPMAKLAVKMGDGLTKKPQVQALTHFIESRNTVGPQNAVIPDMAQLSGLVQDSVAQLPAEILFTIVDLFRCALVDPRVSGYFAEETEHETVRGILEFVNEQADCPYALRLVTLQLGCNLFSTPLFPDEILRNTALRTPIIQLISSSFLDNGHSNVRVAASSLLFNLALADRQSRGKDSKANLPDGDQVELAASVVEAIVQEEKSVEALQGMLSALGHLVYGTDLDGELADLMRALDAQGTISAKRKTFPTEKLVAEVADELLGKGLRRP